MQPPQFRLRTLIVINRLSGPHRERWFVQSLMLPKSRDPPGTVPGRLKNSATRAADPDATRAANTTNHAAARIRAETRRMSVIRTLIPIARCSLAAIAASSRLQGILPRSLHFTTSSERTFGSRYEPSADERTAGQQRSPVVAAAWTLNCAQEIL